jgi:hypothetical protein
VRRSRRITLERLLVALVIVATAVAVAVVLGATRLFGHETSSRAEVARYITSVDDAQRLMRPELTELLYAYQTFGAKRATRAGRARLSAAEGTLRTLAARIRALPAPPEAKKLRLLLLDLVRSEVGVAHELNRLASFVPAFKALVAVATATNTSLGRELAASSLPKPDPVRGTADQIATARAAYAAQVARAAQAQADAVARYVRALESVRRRLAALHPPALMAPVHRAEVRTLAATGAAGDALAAELRKDDRSRVPQLSRALAEAARISSRVGPQESEIAAIKAYNERVREIGKVESRVQVELARLERRLH